MEKYMKVKQLTEEFAVADQLTADDVDILAAAGYRTIICNRPDGEAAGQPLRAEVEAVAQEHGMGFRYIRSEEHTSELQSRPHLVCRLLLEKKKKKHKP